MKESIPAGMVQRGFHYTTAISYPFEIEPFLVSRYGNGYGSMELETTIHETIYHMMIEELIEGLNERIIRERPSILSMPTPS